MDNGKSASTAVVTEGLRGVVAASSSIGDVNGEKGELIYQGVSIHDLAEQATFEEVVFLLWYGHLPNRAELDAPKETLAAAYELPEKLYDAFKYLPADADPMASLRTVVSA